MDPQTTCLPECFACSFFASLLVLILWYIACENNCDSNFLDLGLCLVLWALGSELLSQFSLLALALVWLSIDCYKHRHEGTQVYLLRV